MGTFLEAIGNGQVLVGDGAWGTMLMERGLDPRNAPESVNLDAPAVLAEIAVCGVYRRRAPSLITTNTFGASPIKLAHYGLKARTEEINRVAVEALRSAVGDHAYVSASVGPTGTMLRPGRGGHEEVADSFGRQTAALIDAGADVICVETMMDVTEARLAVQAAPNHWATIPIMATMTFDATPRGFFTLMGNSIEAAAEGLTEAGADIVGSNCGNGIEKLVGDRQRTASSHGLADHHPEQCGSTRVAGRRGGLPGGAGVHRPPQSEPP